MNWKARAAVALITALLAACGTAPKKPAPKPRPPITLSGLSADGAGREILMVTMGLIGLDYRFGGSNPEAGLDCSGMVGYIYRNAVGVELPRTAAQIADVARPIPDSQLRVGDLVFFNTSGKPFSHMGIYVGDGKFAHAPSSNSQIRLDYLSNSYFAARYQGARTVFN